MSDAVLHQSRCHDVAYVSDCQQISAPQCGCYVLQKVRKRYARLRKKYAKRWAKLRTCSCVREIVLPQDIKFKLNGFLPAAAIVLTRSKVNRYDFAYSRKENMGLLGQLDVYRLTIYWRNFVKS